MTNQRNENPLDKLFVDNKPLDLAILANLIEDYVQLYADTSEIELTEKWDKLTQRKKILIYLLGRKALKESGKLPADQEQATPSQIEADTGIKGNSVRPTLSRLLDERLVRSKASDKGERKYLVPNHVIDRIYNEIAEKD
ncbi:MAG: hypothetical protein JW966_13610 [Anaerolineae bacterium]|nr:hypothetical protein [Anaerolineae bacterium]